MFVLCVLHSKDERHSQGNQDKEVVQMKYREETNESRRVHLYSYLYVVIVVRFCRGDWPVIPPGEFYQICVCVCVCFILRETVAPYT
jgi:hypothetical protein